MIARSKFLFISRHRYLSSHWIAEKESMKYLAPLNRSRCCIHDGQKHKGCYCEKELSFCKLTCDDDPHCKGYTGEGDSVCQISTSSTCPLGCQKFAEGQVSDLERNSKCGSGDGCFIKKSGRSSEIELTLLTSIF